MIGIFGMDPGGATGLAWGVFDLSSDSISEVLLGKKRSGSATVEGGERTQIIKVSGMWSEFYKNCVLSDLRVAPSDVWFVSEDFIYSSENIYGGEDSKISLALIWGIEGYRMGRHDEWRQTHKRGPSHRPTMILQTAGQAKTYATNERLREWGLWVKGRDHERSAWQHIALFLERYMIQHGPRARTRARIGA